MRADLLALSHDDLAALSNRGTVKRALREIESGEVTGKLSEAADGEITVKWSDGVTCVLPGNAVVANTTCSCPATELCRHVIRMVVVYQKQSAKSDNVRASGVWNPGEINDDVLAGLFKPAVFKQAQTQLQNGLLIELVRSHKPIARFHDLACTLRFQVPGDARYVHCDCAGEPPCIHVLLAIWAFRRLPAEKTAGTISTQEKPPSIPIDVLDRVDETIVAGLESGLSEATRVYRDRLARLEIQCRDAGLIWPAEVIVEMIGQHDRYIEHDARFSPEHLSELIGELLIRCDAIRNNTGAVPQLLVRGTAKDQWTDLASARFIGLGCGVRTGRKSATLTSYLQDANSGSMVAVQREFADPPDDSKETPKPFWQLAQTPVVKGATFAQVGAGQLLTQGGKRATDHQLVLGRAKATVNPQNFSWESLRPPVLAENFAEIRARLGALPPASLRPRRVAEDFHVCQIAAVEQAVFASDVQMIHAIVKDSTGDTAVLHHPYTSRGSEGAERLLGRLNAKSQSVQFVAGPTRLTSEGLRIEPISVILRDSNRSMLQPWIDRLPESTSTMAPPNQTRDDPIAEMGKDLAKTIGDLLVVGLYRADPTICRSLQEVVRTAESMGLARMASAIRRVENGLAGKSSAMNWNWRPTGLALLDLVVLSRLLQESK